MLKKLLSVSFLFCTLTWAHAFNVTFQVDMSQQSGFTTPEVNGTFNNWCGNCFQMTDANGDNIWEATTDLPAGTYEYKFSADAWGMQETLLPGSACTVTSSGFTNRTISVTADMVLPVICWGSCVDCAQTPNVYTVVFQVDMNGVTGFTTPEVNGTFNGWCGSCTAMFDPDGDNVWSVPVVLQEGPYEYKFSYDSWAGQETLVPGSSCTVTTDIYTNRTINVTGNDTLEAVCFGSCTPCGQSSGPYNVTFAVDMSEVSFAYTTPEVNGNFNNFCGSCAPMADPDGDHIYTITIPLNPGSYVYKFSYDNWSGQEELIPGSACTLTESGFTNRTLEVTENTVLSNVCWSSCETCTVGVGESQSQKLSVYPNPSNGILNIILPTLEQVSVSLKDMTGRAVLSTTSNRSAQLQLDVASFAPGTYVLEAANGKELSRQVVQLVK
jgi:1,4-alpha-glucan branching enzyme